MSQGLTSPPAPELFDDDQLGLGSELLTIERRAAAGGGDHDGSRIVRDRERLEAILQALAEGMPVRQVCRAYRVSHNTLAAIRQRWPESADTEKKRLASLCSTFARTAIERALDDVDRIPPGMLVLAAAQATDKMLLLTGEATSRVEHKREIGREDVEGYLRRLPSAASSGAVDLGPVQPASIDSATLDLTAKDQ